MENPLIINQPGSSDAFTLLLSKIFSIRKPVCKTSKDTHLFISFSACERGEEGYNSAYPHSLNQHHNHRKGGKDDGF